jgi:diketogulonate reductase-like aldo/keto reductase
MFQLANAIPVSRIGLGCGRLGLDSENVGSIEREIEALRFGIQKGLNFIDTAEVYADGRSEFIVGKAIEGVRHQVFVASKFSPENADHGNVIKSLENSLKRLNTDYLDLYQIHWPNPKIPIIDTLNALKELKSQGKILNVGVSNFSKREMKQAQEAMPELGLISNQVELNLVDRFTEEQLLPYCKATNTTLIAYSPLDKGRNAQGDPRFQKIQELAAKYGKTTTQIALNWLISKNNVLPIPASANPKHLLENLESADFELEKKDILEIDQTFATNSKYIPIDMIEVSLKGEGMKKVYQTLEEALRNELNLVPSPTELARHISEGDPIKPVRLVEAKFGRSARKYDLVEGRLRYWAWVIAFEGKKPIPAYVRYA